MNTPSLAESTYRKNTQHDTISRRDSVIFQQKRCDYSSLELKCARTQRWQAHILELLNACVCAVNNGEWRQALAAAQAKQLQLYGDNSHDKVILFFIIIKNKLFLGLFDAMSWSNFIKNYKYKFCY